MENRIWELRKGRGLTQEELAALLGVTHATVQRYESGKRRLGSHRVKQLAKIFRCHPGEIFKSLPETGGLSHISPAANSYGFLERQLVEAVVFKLFDKWVSQLGTDIRPKAAVAAFTRLYDDEIGSKPKGRGKRLDEGVAHLVEAAPHSGR